MPGEQVFYNYRNRSNENLLLFFSFCIPDNEYNSLLVHLRTDPLFATTIQEQQLAFEDVVDMTCTDPSEQVIKLKKDQICPTLLSYLRLMHRHTLNEPLTSLVKPCGTVQHELEVLDLYLDILEKVQGHLLQDSSIEQDEYLVTRPHEISELLDETRYYEDEEINRYAMAITYRLERKKILASQFEIVRKIKRVLLSEETCMLETESERTLKT